MSGIEVIESADQLRDKLMSMNYDQGVDPTLSGVDAKDQPFLAMLRGAYIESDVVLFNTPWDSETSTEQYHCEECMAQEPGTFADLRFPVVVLALANGADQ